MYDVKLVKQHAQQYHKTHNNTDINVEIQYCFTCSTWQYNSNKDNKITI